MNLLFLYTDEQRFDTLAGYGNDRIEMPNLNRLAEQCCVVDRAYVTQPVCTPSRSSLLTGLYPHTNGCTANNLPLPEEVPCFPEMLTRGRYATGHFGKWHLGDELFAQHGFQEWISIEDMYNGFFSPGRARKAISDYNHWASARGHTPKSGDRCFSRNEAATLPEDVSKPAFLSEQASRFIRAHQKEPFCLFVNFLEPHAPFTGPRDTQYPPQHVPLPPNHDCPPGEGDHLRDRMFHALFASGRRFNTHTGDPDEMRRLIARYWGLCSQVDTHCGAILQTLESCGLWDDTIIVFTSDHGDMMGSHQLITKSVMYEESVRVPLLVKLPGQRKPLRLERPFGHADLVPTLLDAMGERVPDHLEGRSQLAEVRGGPPNAAANPVVIEWNLQLNGLAYSREALGALPPEALALADPETLIEAARDEIRTVYSGDGRWKLAVSMAGYHTLYDLRQDPYERRNTYGQSGLADIVSGLMHGLHQWQEHTNDKLNLPRLP